MTYVVMEVPWPVSIAKPLTKLWVCVECGTLYELLPNAQPPRGWDGQVLCEECNEHPRSEIVT